jgi:hypothetical protein
VVEPVAVQSTYVQTHRVKRVRHTELWEVPGCPVGYTGMFRGTLYCENGHPMR